MKPHNRGLNFNFSKFSYWKFGPKNSPQNSNISYIYIRENKIQKFPNFFWLTKKLSPKNTHTWQSCHGSKRHATFCVHTDYPSTPFLPHAEGGWRVICRCCALDFVWARGQSPKSRELWARGLGCNGLTSVPPRHKNQGANKSQVGYQGFTLVTYHVNTLTCIYLTLPN